MSLEQKINIKKRKLLAIEILPEELFFDNSFWLVSTAVISDGELLVRLAIRKINKSSKHTEKLAKEPLKPDSFDQNEVAYLLLKTKLDEYLTTRIVGRTDVDFREINSDSFLLQHSLVILKRAILEMLSDFPSTIYHWVSSDISRPDGWDLETVLGSGYKPQGNPDFAIHLFLKKILIVE